MAETRSHFPFASGNAALAVFVSLLLMASTGRAMAEPCGKAAFQAVVAEASTTISGMNEQNKAIFQEKLLKLKTSAGWSDGDYVAKATPFVKDARTAELDAANQALLAKVQTLGDAASADKACDALSRLKATMAEVIENTRAKWDHMIAKVTQAASSGPVHAGAAQ